MLGVMTTAWYYMKYLVTFGAATLILLLCLTKPKDENRTDTRQRNSTRDREIFEPPAMLPEPTTENPYKNDIDFEPVRTMFGAKQFNVANAEKLYVYKYLKPQIPHVLHQTWRTNMVPEIFRPWIQSVLTEESNSVTLPPKAEKTIQTCSLHND